MRSAARAADPRAQADGLRPPARESSYPNRGARAGGSRTIRRRARLSLAIVPVAGGAAACQSEAQQRADGRAGVDTVAVRTIIDSLRTVWQRSVAASDFPTMTTLSAS